MKISTRAKNAWALIKTTVPLVPDVHADDREAYIVPEECVETVHDIITIILPDLKRSAFSYQALPDLSIKERKNNLFWSTATDITTWQLNKSELDYLMEGGR